MHMFIFKSEANSELQAFAQDPGGQQLPSRFGPWHAIGVVRAESDPPYKLDRAAIEQSIASQGFALFRKKIKRATN